MRFAAAALGLGAVVTATAAALVWALTGAPPPTSVARGATVAGPGWEFSDAAVASTDRGPAGEPPEGTRWVVLEFTIAARAPLAPDRLGCTVVFRSGQLVWRPDNAALPVAGGSTCYGLVPGPNRLAYSVTVPSGLADQVVAEVTVSPDGEDPSLRWFGGESVLLVSG